MLNPAFPRTCVVEETLGYVLPKSHTDFVYRMNAEATNGPELRLQREYSKGLWRRLELLGMPPLWWQGKNVLDLCCGTGFLSYHLLNLARPATLTLLDIGEGLVATAEQLVAQVKGDCVLKAVSANALHSGCPPESFDVVIGNSYLHHFPDVPAALREFWQLLKPGGFFASLHEPKPAAVALESRNPANWLAYARKGGSFVEDLRPDAGEVPHEQGTDVWMFEEQDLRDLLQKAGFANVAAEHWNFLQPLVTATCALYLDARRPRLGIVARNLMRCAGSADAILRRVLPNAFFASLAFSAQRPA